MKLESPKKHLKPDNSDSNTDSEGEQQPSTSKKIFKKKRHGTFYIHIRYRQLNVVEYPVEEERHHYRHIIRDCAHQSISPPEAHEMIAKLMGEKAPHVTTVRRLYKVCCMPKYFFPQQYFLRNSRKERKP